MLTQLLKISHQYSYLPNKQFCPNNWVPYPSIPNRQGRPAFLGI